METNKKLGLIYESIVKSARKDGPIVTIERPPITKQIHQVYQLEHSFVVYRRAIYPNLKGE